jgi:hypothetical protein
MVITYNHSPEKGRKLEDKLKVLLQQGFSGDFLLGTK